MKIEHTLDPATVQFAAGIVRQLNAKRAEYLAFLGQAKEVELQVEMMRQALSQHLQLVEQTAQLPKPVRPYMLSDDGTKLIGETADPQPAGAAVPDAPAAVNGRAAEAHYGG